MHLSSTMSDTSWNFSMDGTCVRGIFPCSMDALVSDGMAINVAAHSAAKGRNILFMTFLPAACAARFPAGTACLHKGRGCFMRAWEVCQKSNNFITIVIIIIKKNSLKNFY